MDDDKEPPYHGLVLPVLDTHPDLPVESGTALGACVVVAGAVVVVVVAAAVVVVVVVAGVVVGVAMLGLLLPTGDDQEEDDDHIRSSPPIPLTEMSLVAESGGRSLSLSAVYDVTDKRNGMRRSVSVCDEGVTMGGAGDFLSIG